RWCSRPCSWVSPSTASWAWTVGSRRSWRGWRPTTRASVARRAAACRVTSRDSPADAKEAWHEDLRPAHPHDVPDDERLPGHGGGGNRRRRRALVLAGSAPDPRGDVRGLLRVPPRLG